MFKRKPKAGAEQPQDFPIVNGEPVVKAKAKPKPVPEPVAAAPEPTILPEPAKRPTPESHPHLFDIFANPL